MGTTYLPEIEGVYLEDSYFLGFMVEGPSLRLNALFALTSKHAAYDAPNDGEAHCYRQGYLLIESPIQIETKPGPTCPLMADPDGSFDLGGIELHERSAGGYLVVTEWFELSFFTDNLAVQVM